MSYAANKNSRPIRYLDSDIDSDEETASSDIEYSLFPRRVSSKRLKSQIENFNENRNNHDADLISKPDHDSFDFDFLRDVSRQKQIDAAKYCLRNLGYDETEPKDLDQISNDEPDSTPVDCESQTFENVEVSEKPIVFRDRRGAITSLDIATINEHRAFTGSKDCSIIEWDLSTGQNTTFSGRRNCAEPKGGHFAQCLDVCCSPDGNILFSCGVDRTIRVWDTRQSTQHCTMELLGHQGSVTGVCISKDLPFSEKTCDLYSIGEDKALKKWDLLTQKCVQTNYGHTSRPTSIDLLRDDLPVTAAEDHTVRLWKTNKNTHLLFEHHTAPIDSISCVNSQLILSGSQDNSVALWTLNRRKAKTVIGGESYSWITAVGAVHSTNIYLRGTIDGELSCWKIQNGENPKLLRALQSNFQLGGVITRLRATKERTVAALSTEHRLGRWNVRKKQTNGICIIKYNLI